MTSCFFFEPYVIARCLCAPQICQIPVVSMLKLQGTGLACVLLGK